MEDYQGFDLFEPPKRKKPRPRILDDTTSTDDAPVMIAATSSGQVQERQQYVNNYLSSSGLEGNLTVGAIVSEGMLSNFEKSEFEKVYFDFGSAELGKQAKLSLDNLIDQLKDNIDYVEYIQIVANTDDVGTDQANMALSEDRGNMVREYLASKGYPADRVLVSPKGEAELVTNGTSWYERFFDRRAEVFIYSSVPLEFDKSRKLLVRRDMQVRHAAEILKLSPTKIKLWNEMGTDALKAGDVIRVEEPVYSSNVKYFLDETDVKNKFFAYRVGRGETITAVARKFRTPEELLVEINQLEGEVSEGDVVFVYNTKRN